MAGFGFQGTTYSLFLQNQVCSVVLGSRQITELAKLSKTEGDDNLLITMQFDLAPDKIGLVFLANAVPYAVFAPLSGVIADKIVG